MDEERVCLSAMRAQRVDVEGTRRAKRAERAILRWQSSRLSRCAVLVTVTRCGLPSSEELLQLCDCLHAIGECGPLVGRGSASCLQLIHLSPHARVFRARGVEAGLRMPANTLVLPLGGGEGRLHLLFLVSQRRHSRARAAASSAARASAACASTARTSRRLAWRRASQPHESRPYSCTLVSCAGCDLCAVCARACVRACAPVCVQPL